MVIDYLKSKSVDVKRIVFKLTQLSASEKPQHESYLKENLEELEKCKEPIQLVSRLNLYWNYLSPQLLHHIVGKFLPKTDVEKEMVSYNEHLRQFRCCTLLRLFCQIEEQDIEPPEGFSHIVTKFSKPISDKTTLQDVENFRVQLACHYKLRDFALMLKPKVKAGSFLVTYFVPNSVLERLKTDIPKKDLFEEFGITQLDINGHCVYCDASETTLAMTEEAMKTTTVPRFMEISVTLPSMDASSTSSNTAPENGLSINAILVECVNNPCDYNSSVLAPGTDGSDEAAYFVDPIAGMVNHDSSL